MSKKEEIIIYPNITLLDDFCKDFMDSFQIGITVKKYIRNALIMNCIYLVIYLLLRVLNVQDWIHILLTLLIIIGNFILVHLSIPKDKVRDAYKNLYPVFAKLLKSPKYRDLNSLNALDELRYYIQNIKNKNSFPLIAHSFLWTLTSLIASNIISLFFSQLESELSFIKLIIPTSYLILLLLGFYIIKRIYDIGYSTEYEKAIDQILLCCIEERRCEILNQHNNNLVSQFIGKIKSFLS